MIIDSGIEFEGIEYDAVSKYLGEHMSKEEIMEEKFEEIVYMKNENVKKRRRKTGKSKTKNTNTDEDNEGKTEIVNDTHVSDDGATEAHKNEETYLKPVRTPTDTEKRNMLAKSIEIMIIATLENHIYKFGNEIRRQREGGPIGLAITGEIADCYMLNWDKEFLKKMKALKIEPALYERFKDDITILLRAVEAGTKFKDGELVNDPEKKITDEGKTDEEITMEVVREVADSVDEMIKFTVDYPGNHKSGKMPVLDVEAAINKAKRNKIEFEFYEKPTKNKSF